MSVLKGLNLEKILGLSPRTKKTVCYKLPVFPLSTGLTLISSCIIILFI